MTDRWQFYLIGTQWWWRRVASDNTVIAKSERGWPTKSSAFLDAYYSGWRHNHKIEHVDAADLISKSR